MAFYTDEGLEAFADWLLQEQAAALEAARTAHGAENLAQSNRFNRAAAAMGAVFDYRVFRGRGVAHAASCAPGASEGQPCE